MTKKSVLLIHIWLLLWSALATAQPLCKVVRYDEEDGVPSSHVTQLLQDDMGFMWFATWNGLCRYDGYEFKTFKPQVGDGCTMTTDRIRNIDLLPGRRILCQVDEDYYLFDLKSYRFRDLTAEEKHDVQKQVGKYRASRSLQRKPITWTDHNQTQWTLDGEGHLSYNDTATGEKINYPLHIDFRTLTFAMPDNQGNLWALDYSSIYKFCTEKQHIQRLEIEPKGEVKCLFCDSKGRYWVTTKDDKAVRVYRASNHQLLGYLGSDGRIHQGYTSFGAAVYCMFETPNGILWLGTKPDGLFRLQEEPSGLFKIDHFTDIPNLNIYHITADNQDRLWIATLGGGIYYTNNPNDIHPSFAAPSHYPQETGRRARYMLITDNNLLLVATSGGLLISQLKHRVDDMHFRLHQREPHRRNSLSCSATMDVVQDSQGHFFVSTESGGVNLIENKNPLDNILSFRHLREQLHVQPNDVVQSLTVDKKGSLIAVGSHLISLLDSTGQGRVLDARTFNADFRFSEAHPLQLDNDRWLFGLIDGAFVTTTEHMRQQTPQPKVVLTGVSIQGSTDNGAVAYADTIFLQPTERNFTIRFAALDYRTADQINYAFRLLPHEQWSYIGHDRSATLLDLEPGTYQMEIRSTNADGLWSDDVRVLTIVVKPTFWESVWGQLLILLLVCGTIAAITYTLLYIRRIQRQHHETLEKYLALIEVKGEKEEISKKKEEVSKETEETTLDPTLQRVMKFVEENISNSDVNVGDMAAAAATSRSGLQRKLKQAMGITPQDLLREARIKRACHLLRHTDHSIADIAYACGFTDPKYFGRNFKQSTGQSPTEYRENTL